MQRATAIANSLLEGIEQGIIPEEQTFFAKPAWIQAICEAPGNWQEISSECSFDEFKLRPLVEPAIPESNFRPTSLLRRGTSLCQILSFFV